MVKRIFTGFSTVDSEKTRQRTFYDLELAKRDLMNHFHTRPGERVMRPEWGCRVWDYLMEPMTPGIKEIIVEEVTEVVRADRRFHLAAVEVVEFDHGIRIDLLVDYLPEKVRDTFSVDFDRRNASFFS